MPTLDQIRACFSGDRFATEAAGIHILEAEPGRALCEMPLRPIHLNAAGKPMGGAIFTLADFAFAVASNHTHHTTVAQQVSINFLSGTRGTRLFELFCQGCFIFFSKSEQRQSTLEWMV